MEFDAQDIYPNKEYCSVFFFVFFFSHSKAMNNKIYTLLAFPLGYLFSRCFDYGLQYYFAAFVNHFFNALGTHVYRSRKSFVLFFFYIYIEISKVICFFFFYIQTNLRLRNVSLNVA